MLHHLADKESRKAEHKDAGGGCPHMLKNKLAQKKTVLAEQKSLTGTQGKKKDFGRRGRKIRRTTRMILGYLGQKLERVKPK